MKRIYMVLLATILLTAGSFAQKGNTMMGIGGDLSLPSGEFGDYFNTGKGIYAKSFFGVGKSTGQVTFTGGMTSFKEQGEWEDYTLTVTVIPLLIGYRHNFATGFFLEPQVGYGIYNFKYIDNESSNTISDNAITWAGNIGYVFNKQFEVSARFQSGGKDGQTISMFGLRVGYNFSLGSTKRVD